MFQSQVCFPVTLMVDYDPAADDVIPLWRAPAACEVKGAYATVANDVAASTANYFTAQLGRPARPSVMLSAGRPAGPVSRRRNSR